MGKYVGYAIVAVIALYLGKMYGGKLPAIPGLG